MRFNISVCSLTANASMSCPNFPPQFPPICRAIVRSCWTHRLSHARHAFRTCATGRVSGASPAFSSFSNRNASARFFRRDHFNNTEARQRCQEPFWTDRERGGDACAREWFLTPLLTPCWYPIQPCRAKPSLLVPRALQAQPLFYCCPRINPSSVFLSDALLTDLGRDDSAATFSSDAAGRG